MQSATKISLVALVVAVAALVFALWPVVADAPWEDGVTSSELSEILRAEQETSSEEKEADRVAKCESVIKLALLDESPLEPEVARQFLAILLENNCLVD
mgnify:CR=1 FL=1